MTRGMGSGAKWLAIAGLLWFVGCGGGATNANRNVSRGAAVNTTEAITLRYAPAPGLHFRRTTRLQAVMEDRQLAIELVQDETLGATLADVTRRCVRTQLTIDQEVLDVPCEGSDSSSRQIVDRFARLGALTILTYPPRPVRIGESWSCGSTGLEACAWTLRAIEETPAGRVAILYLRARSGFEGQAVPAEMTYAVRISDGVPLSAELHMMMGGQLSLQGTWTSEPFTN